jgi:hypothetical protein
MESTELSLDDDGVPIVSSDGLTSSSPAPTMVVRFDVKLLWKRITQEGGRHPAAVTSEMIDLVSSQAFRDDVRRRLEAVRANAMGREGSDLPDRWEMHWSDMVKLVRRSFDVLALTLPNRVRNPFWWGPSEWDKKDRRVVGVCYHTLKWDGFTDKYSQLCCDLCLR